MIINLKSANLTLTPELKDYLDRRLESVNKFLSGENGTVITDVELDRTTKHHTGDIFRAEINIRVNGRLSR